MQAIAIATLVWIYAVSVFGLLKALMLVLGLNYSTLEFSLILSLFGVGLGFVFYALSFLKSSIKSYIVIGAMGTILLMIFITYLSFGIPALRDLFLSLLKVGLFLAMSSVPLIGVYSILKKQRNALLSSGAGILFLFFFVLILSRSVPVFSVPFYSTDEIAQLLLFVVLLILYLELGATSIYFNSVLSKMAPNEEIDESMLLRFNQVVNRYFVQVPTILVLCYIISLIFFWNSNILSADEFMGIKLSSSLGIFLLVFLTIAGVFLFWCLIPREKVETA